MENYLRRPVLLLMLCLLLLGGLVQAQEEMSEGAYEGAFEFSYPEGWDLQEGTDLVRLSQGESLIVVSGPDNYASVLGGETFASDAEELTFFMDRTGYQTGDTVETDTGALAVIQVELPRRDQSGFAYLVDLDFERRGVVTSLSQEALDPALDAATTQVLETLVYPPNIVDIAGSNDAFSTLAAAVDAAGLTGDLSGGDFTVFAPTNTAFEAALADLGISADDLLADTETLTSILTYHVIEGALSAEDVAALDGETVETLNGATISVSAGDDGVVLNDSVNVVQTDITASNGVIHVIDAVLLPPSDEEEPAEEETADEPAAETSVTVVEIAPEDITTYEGATYSFDYPAEAEVTEGTDIVRVAGSGYDVIVSGPDNYALVLGNQTFDSDQAELEFFLDRSGYSVGTVLEDLNEGELARATVTLARRGAGGDATLVDLDNGRKGVVIVLVPMDAGTEPYRGIAVESFVYPPDVVDLIGENDSLSTLGQAVEAAGLGETLRGTEVTVFAPTNEAFGAALADLGLTAEDVLADTELLTSILRYHVVAGALSSEDVAAVDGDVLESLSGEAIEVSAGGTLLNDGAAITEADIEANNGVIHVIDAVLLPPSFTEPAEEETAEEPETVEPEVLEVGDVATYEGATYSFDYPAEAEITEGTDIVRADAGLYSVIISGPDNYATVLGSQTFDSDQAELEFFLDRSGYVLGEARETDALASVNVTLPRRDRVGHATLVDLDNGRKGVVAVMHAISVDASAIAALAADTFVYPPDVVDLIGSNPSLMTLGQAVEAAGLSETLRGTEVTVFAPTNAAFGAALTQLGLTAEDVLADTELLTSILRYHVVSGALTVEDVVALDGETVETLNGETVSISAGDGGVMLNDSATVTEADIEANNGVIHMIDAVLLPPSFVAAEEEPVEEPADEATEEPAEEPADEEGEEAAEEPADTAAVCTVSVPQAGVARVRVGPGANRTAVVFLAPNQPFEVDGKNSETGELWYRFADKEAAAPGKLINEAWVFSGAVEVSGDCESVPDVDAPPIIPFD